jgi:hypothetical protein
MALWLSAPVSVWNDEQQVPTAGPGAGSHYDRQRLAGGVWAAKGSSRRQALRRPIPGLPHPPSQICTSLSRGNLPRDAEFALDGQAVGGMLPDEQGASALLVS